MIEQEPWDLKCIQYVLYLYVCIPRPPFSLFYDHTLHSTMQSIGYLLYMIIFLLPKNNFDSETVQDAKRGRPQRHFGITLPVYSTFGLLHAACS